MKKLIALIVVSVSCFSHAAGISTGNYVTWVLVSSSQSNQSNFVELENAVGTGECDAGHGKARILFEKDDKDLLSLFLSARVANKKIGFYYNPTTSLPTVSGHGLSTCEIRSAWIEAE